MIKFNGGNPVAICDRCAIIMCYVTCEDNGKYLIRMIKGDSNGDYISSNVGEVPPTFCNKCLSYFTK